MTIHLNPRERIWLESLLSMQEGRSEDIEPFYDLVEKIETDGEFRRTFFHEDRASGQTLWNMDAVEKADKFSLSMTKKQAEKLRGLFSSWPKFRTWDMRIKRSIEDKISDAVLVGRGE